MDRKEQHTGCFTSYLDAVPVGGVHHSRDQVLGGLPVFIGHPRRIPGQHQHPYNNTTWGQKAGLSESAMEFECDDGGD